MGRAKQEWEEQQSRGFCQIGEKYVCRDCFGDGTIQDFIHENARRDSCDYCGQESEDGAWISAPIDEVMDVIVDGIAYEWVDPNSDGVSWNSREGGWQSTVYDTGELFHYINDELGIEDGELINDIVGALINDEWCQRDHDMPLAGTESVYAWRAFRDAVKHETRYMFFEKEENDVMYMSPCEIHPSEVIRIVGENINEAGLTRNRCSLYIYDLTYLCERRYVPFWTM